MDTPGPAQIIFTYEERVRSFFHRRVAREEDISDLTQEVMCAILTAYPRFRHTSSVSTWVYGICKNQLYTHYHKTIRTRRLISKLRIAQETAGAPDETLLGLLDLSFDRLRPDQRKLYNDFYRYRKTIKEIAVERDLPEGTVKYRLHELRKDLALILGT